MFEFIYVWDKTSQPNLCFDFYVDMKSDPQSLSGHSLLVLSGGERITFISIPEMMFQIFFQILGNMIKVSRPSLFVEPTLCSAESQKNDLWWKRKNWKKEFDNILTKIVIKM